MAKAWIGDFRGKQLKYWREVEESRLMEELNQDVVSTDADLTEETTTDDKDTKKTASTEQTETDEETTDETTEESSSETTDTTSSSNYLYITEDNADYSWFDTLALQRLVAETDQNLDIIVMLGFVDCVNSCIWKETSIEDFADKYIKSIQKLRETYAASNIYFCSVNPVDGGYPSAFVEGGVISDTVLNAAIDTFNKKLEEAFSTEDSTIKYIDSNKYLKETSFSTRDGIFYTPETCLSIHSYIASFLQEDTAISFIPRLAEPPSPDAIDEIEGAKYWIATEYGGYNIYKARHTDTGSVLPNCVSYAWGRFYEILGSEPELPECNSDEWYDTVTAYEKGGPDASPRLGAVMCWEKGCYSGLGHVAIVEQINSDGSVTISESGWGYDLDTFTWQTKTFNNDDGHWGHAAEKYVFQGFIYNPGITGGSSATTDVVIKNGVTRAQVVDPPNKYLGETDMQTNAGYIWQYLYSHGWSLNAVAAILGNMEEESKINPGLVESSDYVTWPSSNDTETLKKYFSSYKAVKGRTPGYGLVQWTGRYSEKVTDNWDNNKFVYWCKQENLDPTDIDSQLMRITYEAENGIQWRKSNYSPEISFKDFIVSEKPASELGGIFMRCYERPNNWRSSEKFKYRGKLAEKWYEFLLSYTASIEFVSPFSINDFRINELAPTQFSASFLACRGKLGEYTLFKVKDDKEEEIITETVDVSNIKETDEPEADTNEYKAEDFVKISKISYDKLVPNTSYKIIVKVTGENDSDITEEELLFTTPQDFPKSVTNLKIKSIDSKLLNKAFTLTYEKPVYWGYWEKNSKGYELNLIINGKSVATKTITNLDTNSIIYPDEFFNYQNNIGNTVQIGLRTWVKDDQGTKLFDSEYIKSSNSICLLNKPFKVYLKRSD